MLERTLKNLPDAPGVYKFYNDEKLLYIGKAKVLKNRVKSYFKFTPTLGPASKLSPRIHKMICEVKRLEYILSPSEYDALILENSLIKELKPKYNILLRDDKTYPYIAVDLGESFPRFEITRKIIKNPNIKYFGPFSSAATDILKALYLTHKLVQKKACLKEGKACLFHQLDRCFAPCIAAISPQEYMQIVKQAIESLVDRKKLIAKLENKMFYAAELMNFEEAALLRDMQKSIKNSLHVIHLDLAKIENFDLFAIEVVGNVASIMRLFVREGKVVSSIHNIVKNSFGYELGELYKRALIQFYNQHTKLIAAQILTAHNFEEKEDVKAILQERYGQKITIQAPKIGDKAKLIKIARENARESLSSYLNKNKDQIQEELKELFDLQNKPLRIEIFDNSHISGDSPVGCMVTYEDTFIKSAYRIFNLKARDEYAQMHELLSRRIEHFTSEPPPDLWILDGGDTLLKLAQKLLKNSAQQIDLLAISKEKRDAKSQRAKGGAKDIIYNCSYSFKLPLSDKRLQFVQKLRDEAHRFAIKSHRSRKQNKDMQVSFLQIQGIGEASVKKLLNYFGSFEEIYNGDLDTLIELLGKKSGQNLYKHLKG